MATAQKLAEGEGRRSSTAPQGRNHLRPGNGASQAWNWTKPPPIVRKPKRGPRWRGPADAQFLKWLMEHQKEAGVFTTVAALVDQLTDNPAARLTAQEIAARVQRAGSVATTQSERNA